MLGYGIREANIVDVDEVTAYDDFIVFTKDSLGDIWYYDRIYMMDLVVECFDLQICHTGSIYVLSHPNIFSQYWEIL